MNKESLNKAGKEIITLLDNLDINNEDKLELMINLYHFLDPKKYKKNVKVLKKEIKNGNNK